MHEQRFNENGHKEQINTEKQREISRREEKKTSKQIEVLVNSSVEMSLRTDSDLLRTSVASKLKRPMPYLDKNFQFEPNGSRPTSFYLSEENL